MGGKGQWVEKEGEKTKGEQYNTAAGRSPANENQRNFSHLWQGINRGPSAIRLAGRREGESGTGWMPQVQYSIVSQIDKDKVQMVDLVSWTWIISIVLVQY